MNKKSLYGILAASLLLNAFLVGMTLSNCMPASDIHGHGPFRGDPTSRMQHAVSVLDPAYQDQVKTIIQSQQKDMDTQLDQMRALFTQIEPVLTAPTFDSAKMEKLHQQIGEHDRKLKEDVSGMIQNIAKALPDEQRIKFFKKAIVPLPPAPGATPPSGPAGQ